MNSNGASEVRAVLEAGVERPQFYAAPLGRTGDPPKCRQCDALARDPNLKKGG